MKVSRHVEAAINVLLEPYGFKQSCITQEQFLVLPELIQAAVRKMLVPYQDMKTFPSGKNSAHNDERYLPVAKAALYCGISRWTLSRAARTGQLKEIKLSPARSGKVLYDRSELDRWMANQQSSI